MSSKEIVLNRTIRIIKILCLAAAFLSLLLFIPALREIIISYGEKFMHRALNHSLWSARIIKWETQFFLTIAVILFMIFNAFTDKLDNIYNKTYKIISWISIFLFSFLLIFIACQSKDIWLDETFSLGLARHPVKELIQLTAQDVHPPLYYMILRAALIVFPDSVTAAKLISVIPVILIMVISNLFFAREFSYKSGLVFNLLFLSAYSILEYAVEIRMYSWCMLFCMLCCICSFYIIKKSDFLSFILYVLFAECGAYCQYWTAFGLAINFLFLSIVCIIHNKKTIKNIVISAAIGIILFIPWAKVVVSQLSDVSGEYWISPVTFLDFVEFILFEIPMTGVLKLASIVLLVYLVKNTIKGIKAKDFNSIYDMVCFLSPYILIISATIICLAFKPVFQAKYALPLSVFVTFFITISLTKYSLSKKYNVLIKGLCLICIIFNMSNIFLSEHLFGKDNKAFRKMMNENRTDNTVFIFDEDIHKHIPYCIAYNYPQNRIYNQKFNDLWTKVYFYDQKNIIYDIPNEKDLCLVLNEDTEPYGEFQNVEYIKGNISNYPAVKFYFLKKTDPEK